MTGGEARVWRIDESYDWTRGWWPLRVPGARPAPAAKACRRRPPGGTAGSGAAVDWGQPPPGPGGRAAAVPGASCSSPRPPGRRTAAAVAARPASGSGAESPGRSPRGSADAGPSAAAASASSGVSRMPPGLAKLPLLSADTPVLKANFFFNRLITIVIFSIIIIPVILFCLVFYTRAVALPA